MHPPSYYREQSKRARRLALLTTNQEVGEQLARSALDYAEIASDLESNAIAIRHPELLPQRQHPPADS